jgi:4-hydroxybenzoate polyprenyltransferase
MKLRIRDRLRQSARPASGFPDPQSAIRTTRERVPRSAMARLRVTLEMIKIEHTLFALPFAFLGATLAAQTMPPQRPGFWISKLVWIIIAMVGARSAAMTFNRIADRDIDRANPRTATRALPAGALDIRFAWAFTAISAALFLLAASQLNRLTLVLSPVALGSVFLYSYTKRFTFLSHLVLGWCLGLAPAGAWMAVRGDLTLVPVLLSLVVMLWTAGFDVLYACQDYEFDRGAGLHSIPQRFGIEKALRVARGMHALMFAALVWLFFEVPLEYVGCVGILATGALLVYQHSIVKANDLSRLNAAFFTTNAFVSVILFVTIAIDIFVLG